MQQLAFSIQKCLSHLLNYLRFLPALNTYMNILKWLNSFYGTQRNLFTGKSLG